jgi:hypothetical protein
VGQRVFFPTFTRYFLARERSFQMMIEDLLKHRETSRNDDPPLVLKDDVQRWRNIANKRMGYLRDTYRLFKDTISETETDEITYKMCIKQYHALIPQLISSQLNGESVLKILCLTTTLFRLSRRERARGDNVIMRSNSTTKLRNLGGEVE